MHSNTISLVQFLLDVLKTTVIYLSNKVLNLHRFCTPCTINVQNRCGFFDVCHRIPVAESHNVQMSMQTQTVRRLCSISLKSIQYPLDFCHTITVGED